MKEISSRLFIGNDTDCSVYSKKSDYSIIHACKTCHQKILNYEGSLASTNPKHLVYEQDNHLYLNMVDISSALLEQFAIQIFKSAMIFIHREIKNNNVLIHCNFGQSRSASLGLMYLAITGVIPKKSYDEAIDEFIKLYPEYIPGIGIMLFMKNNWSFLVDELSELIK